MTPFLFSTAHFSGRFDKPLKRQVAYMADVLYPAAAVVTFTEQAGDDLSRDRAFSAAGRDFYRALGDFGPDECVIAWDGDAFNLAGEPHTAGLTTRTYKRRSGATAPPCHAVFVPLVPAIAPGRAPIWFVAVHMPVRNTDLRREVWDAAARGLVGHIADLRREDSTARFVVSGDWNVNHRTSEGRNMMRAALTGAGLTSCWRPAQLPPAGTHGRRRLIDATWTDLPCRSARLLPDAPAASDHRAYVVEVIA